MSNVSMTSFQPPFHVIDSPQKAKRQPVRCAPALPPAIKFIRHSPTDLEANREVHGAVMMSVVAVMVMAVVSVMMMAMVATAVAIVTVVRITVTVMVREPRAVVATIIRMMMVAMTVSAV